MNLVLLFDDDYIGRDRVRLRGRRLKHVREVLRAEIGDCLSVGLCGGLAGSGRIISIDRGALEMDVMLDTQPPPPAPATLILCLPRPKVLKRVLAMVGALGVKRIVLLNAYRVEKSYWQSPLLMEENLRKHLVIGLEQARDTVMPEILLRDRFKPFLEDELIHLIKGSRAFVSHPAAADPCPRSAAGRVTVAIGPEGGFIPYEVDKFVSLGFSPVHLGQRTLTVETAIPFFLSRLL